jgi:dTMP kinase
VAFIEIVVISDCQASGLSYLITFEGTEGCGKSTQAKLLQKRLESVGRSCLLTREPGGTRIGREIRKILLNPANRRMASEVEMALYFADRAQHLQEVILPAVDDGKTVICDRFTDSTLAYQGYARGIPRRLIRSLDRILTGAYRPRFTVLLDLPVEVGLRRARGRNQKSKKGRGEARFEAEHLEFHTRVRQGYLQMARKEPDRYVVVDAEGNRSKVHEAVWKQMASRMDL